MYGAVSNSNAILYLAYALEKTILLVFEYVQ